MPSAPTGTVDISGQSNNAGGDVSGNPRFNPVIVNLQANIDLSGNVEVFTVPTTSVSDVVVIGDMSANTLYGADLSGVFEFVEPSGNRGAITGYVSNGANGALFRSFQDMSGALLSGLQGSIVPPAGTNLDASGANPFHSYLSNPTFYQYPSLGDLVLSLYATYIFGHPAATAAITNDAALVTYINGTDGSGAQVALNLTRAIGALTVAQATGIADAVLSQDPNRATNAPNRQINLATGENHVPLVFIRGDIVYVSVTVKAPSVSTIGAGGAYDSTNNGQSNLVGIAANAVSRYPSPAPTLNLQIKLN